jgi:hypothetical protein
MKKLTLIAVAIFLILGCGSTAPSPAPALDVIAATAIAQTQSAKPSLAPTNIPPPIPTNTSSLSPSALPPTEIPAPTERPPLDQKWSKNYVGSVDSGGLIIEIARVVVGYKTAVPDQQWEKLNDYISGWAETPVVGELIFKITNNTSKTIRVYLNQGTVQIGSEQIELSEYMIGTTFGDALGGEIFPGVTKIGGMWFGIKRSNPDQITRLVFRCSAPVDESSNSLGPDIEIAIDTTPHVWEDMPDELK